MSALIREGLMTLWLGQTEGKFEANEVESRSNKCSSYSGAADNGSKTATNANVSEKMSVSTTCISDQNTFGSSRVNEHALPPVDAKVDHKRIDYVTPTLQRRSVDESGRPLVTPFDSVCKRHATGKRLIPKLCRDRCPVRLLTLPFHHHQTDRSRSMSKAMTRNVVDAKMSFQIC